MDKLHPNDTLAGLLLELAKDPNVSALNWDTISRAWNESRRCNLFYDYGFLISLDANLYQRCHAVQRECWVVVDGCIGDRSFWQMKSLVELLGRDDLTDDEKEDISHLDFEPGGFFQAWSGILIFRTMDW